LHRAGHCAGEEQPPAVRIPEKYNRRSLLTAVVAANGANTFDFPLDPEAPRSRTTGKKPSPSDAAMIGNVLYVVGGWEMTGNKEQQGDKLRRWHAPTWRSAIGTSRRLSSAIQTRGSRRARDRSRTNRRQCGIR
jgi:hypothetical protein